MKPAKVHFDFGGGAFCGTRGHSLTLTDDEAKVTCERCRHRIGLQDVSVYRDTAR